MNYNFKGKCNLDKEARQNKTTITFSKLLRSGNKYKRKEKVIFRYTAFTDLLNTEQLDKIKKR